MLINRLRLIESIQTSSSKDRFKDLVSVLKNHQLKDLLLTNVLMEAQTFKVLPLALQSVSGEDALTPENETQAMMVWVITSQPKNNDAAGDDYLKRLGNGEACSTCASDTVEKLVEQINEDNHATEAPEKKSTFYHFCKKLDNAISLTTAQENMLYN